MGKFAPHNRFDPTCYISAYQDAGNHRPYGMRWKAVFVTAPGELTGQPMRDSRGDEMEFSSLRELVAHAVKRHGAVKGDIVRVYLRRYEGKEGFYAVPDRFYP